MFAASGSKVQRGYRRAGIAPNIPGKKIDTPKPLSEIERVMKILSVAVASLGMLVPLAGQETAPKWDVEIPGPIADGRPSEPPPEPEPIDFTVLTSRTTRREVTETPPMPGLPPVQGTIDVTVQLVADPNLPEPPPPLPALPPDDPQVVEKWEKLRETYRGSNLIFLGATVYDERRTLLRIYPNGETENAVTAWSNLNFLHFTGRFRGYRVNYPDGTFEDTALLMGISPIDTGRARLWAARAGRKYTGPEIPELPDSGIAGPAFVVIEGDRGSPAMDTLEQLHALYRKSGQQMAADFHAMEARRAALRAHYLAYPPEPDDLVIRFYKSPSKLSPR